MHLRWQFIRENIKRTYLIPPVCNGTRAVAFSRSAVARFPKWKYNYNNALTCGIIRAVLSVYERKWDNPV